MFAVVLWLPAEDRLGFGGIRFALFGIVNGQRAVVDMSLWILNKIKHLFGKLHNRDFLRVANVDRQVVIAQQQAVDTFHQIIDVAEGAGLGAIAKHGQSFAPDSLAEECRQHPAVVDAHTRAVSIENADDAGVHFVVVVIGHGDGFEEALGLIVHAAWANGVDIAPILFRLRMLEWIAVHFGGGGYQDSGIFFFRQAQAIVGAMSADFQRLNRHLQVVDRAGRAGKMQDVIELSRYVDELGDVVVVILEVLFFEQVFDIIEAAGEQVVHADDLVAFGEKAVAEVGAEKAGSAGD